MKINEEAYSEYAIALFEAEAGLAHPRNKLDKLRMEAFLVELDINRYENEVERLKQADTFPHDFYYLRRDNAVN